MDETTMGRHSIFRGKKGGKRVQGIITEQGGAAFEVARTRLAKLAKRERDDVSDADTVEYLARGDDSTKRYLKTGK